MKTLLVNTILLWWTCASQAQTLRVPIEFQSMVKHQPFPYRVGVAMDSSLFTAIKAKLRAAEILKQEADTTISDLKNEIRSLNTALSDQRELSEHDFEQTESLSAQVGSLTAKLSLADTLQARQQQALTKLAALLPRRLRKQATTPDQIATCLTTYVERQQARKWKWAGVTTILGAVGTLFLLLR